MEKKDEIIGNLDTLTISVIQDDPEGEEQYGIVRRFATYKQNKKPRIIYRLLGGVDCWEKWERLPGIIARRILHSADGSKGYYKPVTVPEIGICQDLLTHLAIDRKGWASICVRFDPDGLGRIGNLNHESIEDVWNSAQRIRWLKRHINGLRDIVPLCQKCDYWGVPRG
jgi:radical SAM protein with 4Fe4S-binding SPASM domain